LAAVDDVGGQAALTRAGLTAYDVLVLERDLPVVDVGAVLDATGVTALVDRGFRGMAKARARWHAPIGDRRTNDQRTPAERDHNRLQAGLRALVEQAIGHLANAWTLRRWRGLLNPGPGPLPGRRGADLPRPMDPPHPDMNEASGHPRVPEDRDPGGRGHRVPRRPRPGVAAGTGDEPPLSSGLPGQRSRAARRVR
jgi:hypothetical protein